MPLDLPAMRARFPRGVVLLDSVTILESEAGAYQFVASKPFQLAGLRPRRRELLAKLKQGMPWDAFDDFAREADAQAIVAELDRRGLLIERLEPELQGAQSKQLGWLAHFVPVAEVAQQTLRAQHALVVGCGGTGSVVVQHLISIGVGALTLVDYDAVELSNFNRQLPFRRSDIGSPKVDALRDHVIERHPDCRVHSLPKRIGSVEDIVDGVGAERPTVIFCCADTPVGTISALVAQAGAKLGVPCVFGSVGLVDGSVGPLLVGNTEATTAFVAAMAKLGASGARVVGKAAMGASFAPVNTLVAAWMVLEWSKHVLALGTCQILDQSVVFDFNDGARRVEARWGAGATT